VLQERLTHELAGAVGALAGARGVLVVVEALHMCMVARGVEKHASRCDLCSCQSAQSMCLVMQLLCRVGDAPIPHCGQRRMIRCHAWEREARLCMHQHRLMHQLKCALCVLLQHHYCGSTRQPGRGWRCTQPAAAQPVSQLVPAGSRNPTDVPRSLGQLAVVWSVRCLLHTSLRQDCAQRCDIPY
jgi:GTP cyclohydrolase I